MKVRAKAPTLLSRVTVTSSPWGVWMRAIVVLEVEVEVGVLVGDLRPVLEVRGRVVDADRPGDVEEVGVDELVGDRRGVLLHEDSRVDGSNDEKILVPHPSAV